MPVKTKYIVQACVLFGTVFIATVCGHAADGPDYQQQVAPILTKYCAGCHNPDEAAGELLLDTFEGLMQGGESGPAVTPGSPASSRLLAVLTGDIDLLMPPEDEEAPNEAEIAILKTWIESGALGPTGADAHRPQLITPEFKPADKPAAVTALAIAPDGKSLAIARFSELELLPYAGDPSAVKKINHPGKIQSVSFVEDGAALITASGVTGLYGKAQIWNAAEGSLIASFPTDTGAGHRDLLYAAIISPDGKLVATAGYDRSIMIWDRNTGEMIRKLEGHNGAVFDLAFSPDSQLLSSASADATVKVWQVATGTRFDTRSEPLKEQYTTAISPDGTLLVAGGEDSRIRVWQLISTDKPKINPLVYTRFAHEGALHQLRFSEDGKLLVTAGADGVVKLWETESFTQIHSWPDQPASVQALSISSAAGKVVVGRMDGSVEQYPLPADSSSLANSQQQDHSQNRVPTPNGIPSEYAESEPNNSPEQSLVVSGPAKIKGTIYSSGDNTAVDVDCFRFQSLANQTWIIEVTAARNQSPLDSHVEVLNSAGEPIPRVVLQATYESYFTFRGKDSSQIGDFRLHNWEDLRLNQYLYCNGEVVKLYHYPRGPDSGYNVYPDYGSRHTYFDTTPLTHPLNEPCYVVEPHSPGETIAPNGLPIFVVNFENDDDSLRRFGDDSFLTFTAPEDGEYIVRLSDVRGLQGADFKYELAIRAPQPDFAIKTVHQDGTEALASTGHKFGVEIERHDGFDGPVTVHLEGMPKGLTTSSPLVVEPGQFRAWGTIHAAADAPAPSEKDVSNIKLTAVAELDGREVRKWPHDFGKLTLKPSTELSLELLSSDPEAPIKDGLPVIEITPGTTTTFVVKAVRSGYEGRVSLGKQDAAHNAPHGIYVDNIGLNGLQIQAKETERIAFLTAEPWVKPQERVIFVEASEAGKPTSNPVILRVVPTGTNLTQR